jgi:hypothetical protein
MAHTQALRPYTQTHTFVFRGCSNAEAIYSPTSGEKAVRHLEQMFVGKLIEAGFRVTGESVSQANGGVKFKYDVLCRPFGIGHGVTMTAILSASDASYHTYVESRYGRSAELELNLCYLDGRSDHSVSVHEIPKVFGEWLMPEKVEILHSRKRFLRPMGKGCTRIK